MIEAGLVATRFVHFATVMALFGLALFPHYSYPARGGAPAAWTGRWLRVSLHRAALLGLVSGLAWGWFALASMTGTANAAADPDNLLIVLRETSFGQVWVARLALAVALLVWMSGSDARPRPGWVTVSVAAMLLLSLAFVGHTQTNDGALRIIHVSADGAHLLAAGAWLGGLLALGHLLMLARNFPSPEHTADAAAALARFSGMGYVAVAILISSGLINTWMLVGSPANLVTTPYGQLLLVKVCLLAGMLVLAAFNRFRLVPSLQGPKEGGRSAQESLRMLRRNVIGEQMLGLAIVLIIGWLGTLSPAIAASE